MNSPSVPSRRPDFFGQLAATNPFQARARRLFERGRVIAVNGNQADLLVSYDAHNNPLELKQVPIVSGYVPRVGDWVAIQYEAGHAGAPWVTGPSMAGDASEDSAGIGVFSVSETEPADAQKSTIYFDDSRAVWRGYDGTEWVDLSAKVHNLLPDLQGGSAAEYYHFTAAQHGDLQDLGGGEGIASAWVKRLRFKAIDQSATQRTRMFEKDGDFFWAINASYDEVAGTWSRVDITKYAYLVEMRSENGIPSEPVGGIAWWRATPGANPLGAYNAVGGWELGFMMTQHRNFVGGGINFEMDGSGTPPYGRFTQIAGNDVAGGHTLVQRNAWYEGGDSWGRDSHTEESAAVGFDTDGDLFVWWYPDSSDPNGGAPWATSAWQERARLHTHGDVRGRLDVIRSTSETAIACSAFLAKHKTSGDMADGFGGGYALAIEDDAGVENVIGAIYALRAGADNTGKLDFRVATGGTLASKATLDANGNLLLPYTLEVTGQSLFSDKIKFTQTDGNEAIDSLNDGYMDYLATTGHRFNRATEITGDLTIKAAYHQLKLYDTDTSAIEWSISTYLGANLGFFEDGSTLRLTLLTGGDMDLGPNEDVMATIGRAKVGDVIAIADYAGFSHYDHASVTNYALAQQNDGATFLNAATGKSLYFRINNAGGLIMSAAALYPSADSSFTLGSATGPKYFSNTFTDLITFGTGCTIGGAPSMSFNIATGNYGWQIDGTLKASLTALEFSVTGTINTTVSFEVDGMKVVGNQGAAVGDLAIDATLETTITRFNQLLARLRASTGHGLIA